MVSVLSRYSALALLLLVYGLWAVLMMMGGAWASSPLGYAVNVILLTLLVTLHSSLSHEAIHGHLVPSSRLNDALVQANIALLIPYDRYKALHQQHHDCPDKGDPLSDPESYYVLPDKWQNTSMVTRGLYKIRSSLFGRLTIGWAFMVMDFLKSEVMGLVRGSAGFRRAWGVHALFTLPVVAVISMSWISVPHYLVFVVVPSLMLLSLRSYIEHRASGYSDRDTVIVESNLFWRMLFLNNNFHAIHHDLPHLRWWEVAREYHRRRDYWQQRTQGYWFSGYFDIAAKYLFKLPAWLSPPVYGGKSK
ncbi:MAG: fatty acid desaturase [Alphaproteobacteria bacterium]|nr:fatty acid desaturase [Alphaproteobacteria bacterium]